LTDRPDRRTGVVSPSVSRSCSVGAEAPIVAVGHGDRASRPPVLVPG